MLFYIEYPNRRQNGAMSWWEKTDRGYVLGIGRARVFTEEEVREKLSVQMGDKIAWPTSYINKVHKAGIVWFDACDIAEAWKPE